MKIPGYTIRRRLGSGGQAIVYLALQESLQRLVALKVLHPVHSDSPEFTARFLNEARILANLGHSNVITIHDIGVEGEFHYLSMELVEGGDLKRRMREGLDTETVLEYLTIIAECLATAHDQHIVHRDIKPANVLFRSDGTLLLTDFGIAKRLDAEGELTISGTTLGSPHYLSPEQAQGEPLDGRTDIYSLGAMTYEMLAGEKPYPGGREVETILRHINAPVPRLPAPLQRFQEFIDRTMAKSPDDRFENASVVLEYLRALRSGTAGNARPQRKLLARLVDAAGRDDPTQIDPRVTAPSRNGARTTRAVLAVAGVLLLGAWLAYRPTATTTPVSGPQPAALARSAASAGSPDRESTPSPAPAFEAEVPATASTTPDDARAGAETSARDGSAQPDAMVPALAIRTDRPARVRELLAAADGALAALRLTRPEDGSALDYYQQVLAIDPDNAQARQGFTRIASRYAGLARSALTRNDVDRARDYVRRGLTVDASSDELKVVSQELSVAAAPRLAPVETRTTSFEAGELTEEAPAPPPPARPQRTGEGEVQGESPRQLLKRIKSWFD